MNLLIERARAYQGSVVLPEGQDPRVMKAAAEITRLVYMLLLVLVLVCCSALSAAVNGRLNLHLSLLIFP